MNVHLVDGTYELFRHFFALPPSRTTDGVEVAATRGVVASILGMLEGGATHLAVATDHVVESFRNQLWEGYKDGSGIEPELLAQFPILEDALGSMGVAIWPMAEFEADDGLASGARVAAADDRVEQVVICSPDKDLAQCVRGNRVVLLDRRKRSLTNEAGVRERFGVLPAQIPDYLALVGDSADGFPGLRGWGPKSASALLRRYGSIEAIPASAEQWEVSVRGASRLAETLARDRDRALLFRQLATLVDTAPVSRDVDAWRWSGPAAAFSSVATRLGAPALVERVEHQRRRRE